MRKVPFNPTLICTLGFLLISACSADEQTSTADFDDIKETSGIGTSSTDAGTSSQESTADAQVSADPTDISGVDVPAGSIKAIQVKAEEQGCDPNAIMTVETGVSVSDVIVTSGGFSVAETLDGYYVADGDQAPWSGMLAVFNVDEGTNFHPGDTLTLTGEVEEAWCNTQFKVITWQAGALSDTVSPLTVAAEQASWEPYEGMLIELKDVEVTEVQTGGTYEITGGLIVDHDFDLFLSLETDTSYDLIGQLKTSYGKYRLMPRSLEDISAQAGTSSGDAESLSDIDAPSGTVKSLQQEAQLAGCDADNIVTISSGKSLNGVVVMSGKFEAATSLDGYYVADGDQEDWSGMVMVVDASEGTNFHPGDVLDLTGDLEEAWCNTQLSVNTYTSVSTADTPSGVVVDPLTSDWEAKEGLLVRLGGVEVTETQSGGRYKLTGGLVADHDFDFFLSLDEGQVYAITGFIKETFGEYRIMPRGETDIVAAQVLGDAVGSSADVQVDDDATVGPTVNEVSIESIQNGVESLSCTEPDAVKTVTESLAIEGLVTVNGFAISDFMSAYVIGLSGAYTSIVVTVSNAIDQGWSVGDYLRITGSHLEFYCMTELEAFTVEMLPVAGSIGTFFLDTSAWLCAEAGCNDYDEEMEMYEGSLVEVSDVTVTGLDEFEEHGNISTNRPFLMDSWIVGDDGLATPTIGDSWERVTGLLHYSFGEYRISPRSQDDLCVSSCE
jgi:hypothetical protein